jgi:hypothetical protein
MVYYLLRLDDLFHYLLHRHLNHLWQQQSLKETRYHHNHRQQM